jgi:hypothetical protein
MTTWTLWIGAVLVVGGSATQITHQAGAARALWLAVLVFAAAAALAVTTSESSLPLLLTGDRDRGDLRIGRGHQ